MRIWRRNTLQKAVGLLLCLTLVISLVPVPALAAEGDACTVTADCAGVYVEGLCNVCGQPEPAPKHSHVYEGEAQYAQKDETVHTVTRACITCEEQPTETVEEGHTYVEGICACGKAEPCAHSGGNATCKELAVCESCGAPYGEFAGHNYGTDADGKCDVCGADCEHTYVEGVCACGVSEPVAEPECICGVKCNKEHQDEACPVCADGDYAECIGNEISAFLIGSYTSNGAMEYCQSGTTIDVRGANGVSTTFADYGYYLKFSDSLENKATIQPSAEFVNGGSYVKLSYTVTNNTDASLAGAVGICADVQIGRDDKATVSVVNSKTDGTPIGLKMVDENETGELQFNLFFRNTAGAVNADRYWIGEYDSKRYMNHWNDAGELTSISGKDSALAVSWDVSLAAGESKTYSVIVGVGEVADPPAWDATDPVALSMSAEATPDNLLIHVNAKVKDANGVMDTLYYNENGGEEQQLGDSVTGDGTTEKEITGVIDLTGKEDGTYTYQFWIVNNKGATSEVVTRTITITNGEVSGDVVKVDRKYNVRVISPANGSLSASNNGLVIAGTEITLTATPAEGYELQNLTVTDADGNPVTVTDYKFPMPASNVTVTAEFKRSVIFVTGIALDWETVDLDVNGYETLTATITPSDATDKTVAWSSSDPYIAAVDQNGKITAVAPGDAVITATANDGSGVSASCNVHVHEWVYEARGNNKILYYCKNTGKSCPDMNAIDPEDSYVQITAEGGTYNGNTAFDASLAYGDDWLYKGEEPAIIYGFRKSQNESYVTVTELKNAGFYKASITLGDAAAYVEYLVEKAAPTAADFYVTRPENLTYDGSGKTVTAEPDSGLTGMGDVSVVYYNSQGEEMNSTPVNAGTYTVKLNVAEGDNYRAVNGLSDSSWRLTINPKSLNAGGITAELSDSLIFVGDAIPTLTVKDGDTTLVKDRDFTVSQSEKDGLFTVTVTGKGNYTGEADAKPAYLVVSLPDPDKVEPDDKDAIDAYDRYLELNKTYKDPELAEKLEKLQKALTDYDVIKGHKSSYTKLSGKTFSLTANGYLGKFTGLKVDGKLLDPKYYTAKADGGTVVTLKNSYLNGLSDGKHTIEFLYTDGTTGEDHYFRIATNNGSPITGDNSHMMLFGGIMMTSLLCVAMMILFASRKKGKYER